MEIQEQSLDTVPVDVILEFLADMDEKTLIKTVSGNKRLYAIYTSNVQTRFASMVAS